MLMRIKLGRWRTKGPDGEIAQGWGVDQLIVRHCAPIGRRVQQPILAKSQRQFVLQHFAKNILTSISLSKKLCQENSHATQACMQLLSRVPSSRVPSKQTTLISQCQYVNLGLVPFVSNTRLKVPKQTR